MTAVSTKAMIQFHCTVITLLFLLEEKMNFLVLIPEDIGLATKLEKANDHSLVSPKT